jgi:LysR family pca operon transcriptional activator
LPFAGTGEPVGLIRRSDTQPSPVGLALIDALRTVARQRMADAAAAPVKSSASAARGSASVRVNVSADTSAPKAPKRRRKPA